MNNSEISFRKRAVYTGLQPHLNEAELMDALILWESRHVTGSRFSLRHYANDLATLLNRKSELKMFLLSLTSSMVKPEKELLPDPSRKLEAYKKINRVASMPSFTISKIEAFQILVNKWISLEKGGAAVDILQYVSDTVDDLKIDAALKKQIRQWLINGNYRIQVTNVKTSDLRKVINLYYVGFCEHIGPVETDAKLAHVINKLKSNGGAKYSELFAELM